MDRKDIIIIILSLIIIALLAIGAYNQAREDQIIYHTVNITDTFSLDVPISDNVTKTNIYTHRNHISLELNRSICPIIQYGTIERITITLHSSLQRTQVTM